MINENAENDFGVRLETKTSERPVRLRRSVGFYGLMFVSLGSIVLWAGGRPRFFKRLLDRGALSFDRTSLSALMWTAWASIEPHSLRAVLRAILYVRNLRTRLRMNIDGPVVWPTAKPANLASGTSAGRPRGQDFQLSRVPQSSERLSAAAEP